MNTSIKQILTQRTNRRLILKAAALSGMLLWRSASSENNKKPQLQLKKRTKESVKYQDTPFEGRTCAKCMLYIGDGKCAILKELVSPNGWCSQWVPPTIG